MRNFTSSFHEISDKFFCIHTNPTEKIQMIRIKNIPGFYFERVVFPYERLLFEAVEDAKLEIQISKSVTILVCCEQLRIIDEVTVDKLSPSMVTSG